MESSQGRRGREESPASARGTKPKVLSRDERLRKLVAGVPVAHLWDDEYLRDLEAAAESIEAALGSAAAAVDADPASTEVSVSEFGLRGAWESASEKDDTDSTLASGPEDDAMAAAQAMKVTEVEDDRAAGGGRGLCVPLPGLH